MAGEGQLKEQAKYQWDRLDVEGCKITNEILTATPERVEWPEGVEPKFMRKRTSKATRVSYNIKTKRYMYHNNNIVAAGEPIRLALDFRHIFPLLLPPKEKRIHKFYHGI